MKDVKLMGVFTRDPELKTSAKGTSFMMFDLAHNEKINGEKITTYIPCKAFGKTAEIIAGSFRQGDGILVVGDLDVDHWEKNGEKRSAMKVKVNKVYFYAGRRSEPRQEQTKPVKTSTKRYEVDEDEDDVPF